MDVGPHGRPEQRLEGASWRISSPSASDPSFRPESRTQPAYLVGLTRRASVAIPCRSKSRFRGRKGCRDGAGKRASEEKHLRARASIGRIERGVLSLRCANFDFTRHPSDQSLLPAPPSRRLDKPWMSAQGSSPSSMFDAALQALPAFHVANNSPPVTPVFTKGLRSCSGGWTEECAGRSPEDQEGGTGRRKRRSPAP